MINVFHSTGMHSSWIIPKQSEFASDYAFSPSGCSRALKFESMQVIQESCFQCSFQAEGQQSILHVSILCSEVYASPIACEKRKRKFQLQMEFLWILSGPLRLSCTRVLVFYLRFIKLNVLSELSFLLLVYHYFSVPYTCCC